MIFFKEFLLKGELIAIYERDEKEDNKFSVGIVLYFDDNNLLARLISPNGELDSLILYNLDSLIKIEKETNYLKRLKNLYKLKIEEIMVKNVELNSIDRFFDATKNRIIYFNLLGRDELETGLIKKCDDSKVIIENIDNEGRKNGISCFLREDVNYITFDGIDERRDEELLKLQELNKQ